VRFATLIFVLGVGCTSPAETANQSATDAARIPAKHRVSAEACSPEPPASDCSTCSTCADGAICMQGKHICTCRKDACSRDSQCGDAGVCSCRTTAKDARGFNICLAGNCRVDSDCGAGGYCSPTWDLACGESNGVVGYFCHTMRDACVDDTDCVDGGKVGYCAWSSDRWRCAYAVCL
jgi:hypothetical protein